jgi:gas vesicle protein
MIHKGALVLGVLIGAGLGVILAPEKGRTTRDKLKAESRDIKDKFVDDFTEVKDDVIKAAISGKTKLMHEAKDLKVRASYKTEKAINFLEKQLLVLKEKNKRFQQSNA